MKLDAPIDLVNHKLIIQLSFHALLEREQLWSFNAETFRQRPVKMIWYVLKVDNVQIASTMRLFSFNMFWLICLCVLLSFIWDGTHVELITFPASITTTHRMGRSIVKPWSIIKSTPTQLQSHVPLTRPPLSNSSTLHTGLQCWGTSPSLEPPKNLDKRNQRNENYESKEIRQS